ncbi:MAG: TetR/AcrR family transcriptional regulator [Alphaproteobacteria bacterium]
MKTQRKMTKSDRTRSRILAAAAKLFSEKGYEGVSVREVAAHAGIDPALVIRYFGAKDQLFALTAEFDPRLPDFSRENPDAIGEVLISHFLSVWEENDHATGFIVLLRSAASNAVAAERFRAIFAERVQPAFAGLAHRPDMGKRVGLIASQLIGLALARYVLRLPAVVDLSRDEIIRQVGPVLQSYLDSESPRDRR